MFLIFITLSACLANTFCSGDGMICITGNENAYDRSQTCFTVSSKAQGWVGFGIGGRGMDGSDIYVGYRNSTSGYTITNLVGMGHDLRPSDIQNAVPIPLIVSSKTIKDFAYSFCRNNFYGAEVFPSQNYIYAYSHRPPFENINSPLAPLEMHDYFGFFEADFTGFTDRVLDEDGGLFRTTASLSFKRIVIIHGILMWFAWAVLPLSAVFVARYLKSKGWWLRYHAIAGCVILLLTIIAFILILLYKKKHFSNFHSASGLLLVIVLLGQVFLGFYINKMFDKDRFSIPNRDRAHWWIGRFMIVFGLITIQTGFNEYSEEIRTISPWIVAGHYLMVILAIAVLLYGEYMIGPTLHVQKKVQDKDMKEKVKEIWKRKIKTDKEIQNIRYRNASSGLEKEMADLGFDVETDTTSTSSSDSDGDLPERASDSAPSGPPEQENSGNQPGPDSRPEPSEPDHMANQYGSRPHSMPGHPDPNHMENQYGGRPYSMPGPPPDHMGNHPGPHPRPGPPYPDQMGNPYGGGPRPSHMGNMGSPYGGGPYPRHGPPGPGMGNPYGGGPPPHPSDRNSMQLPFHPLELNLPRDFHINVEKFDEENFPLEEIQHVESQEVIRYSGYHRNFDDF